MWLDYGYAVFHNKYKCTIRYSKCSTTQGQYFLNGRGATTTCEISFTTLRWRHNEGDGVSDHQRLDYLLNRLFRRRSKIKLKLHVTGFCEGNPPVTVEIPSQRSSNTENVSIWWRYHDPKDGVWYLIHRIRCIDQTTLSNANPNFQSDLCLQLDQHG